MQGERENLFKLFVCLLYVFYLHVCVPHTHVYPVPEEPEEGAGLELKTVAIGSKQNKQCFFMASASVPASMFPPC